MSIIRKGAVTTGGKFISVAIQVVQGILVARWLQVAGTGQYAFATQFNTVAGTVASFGVGLAGVYMIKSREIPIVTVTTNIIWVGALWCPIYGVLLWFAYRLFPAYFGVLPTFIALCFAASSAVQITANFLRPILLAELRAVAVAVLEITQVVVQTVVTIGLALTDTLTFESSLLIPFVGSMASLLMALWMVRHHINLRIWPSMSLITNLVTYGLQMASTSLAMVVHTQSSVLLMGWLRKGDLEPMGLFSRAASVSALVGLVGVAINPLLYSAWSSKSADAYRVPQAEMATRLYSLIGFATAVVMVLGAPLVLTLLYGSDFAAGAPYLRLLVLAAVFQLMANTLQSLFPATGRPFVSTLLMIGTLLVNLAISWVLIPMNTSYGGAMGAAIAMFTAAIAWALGAALLARHFCGVRLRNCFWPRIADVKRVLQALGISRWMARVAGR